LLRLHLLHLLQHLGAAADDLPHAHLERKRAVLREIGRWRTGPERQLLRHGEAVLAAFLHPSHGLGETGEDLVHCERLGAAVALAAVEHGPVVGCQNIVHQRRIVVGDDLPVPGLDRAELKPARADHGPQRSGADPGKADSCGDDNQEPEPQGDAPAGAGGAMGGFGDGHLLCVD